MVMGSVSAIDLDNDCGNADNGAVLPSQDLEVPKDSALEISPQDSGDNGLKESVLSGNDTQLYYKNGDSFKVVLSDKDGFSLANQRVIFTVNNVNYTRTTNNDGVAAIAINLNSGNYFISSFFLGNGEYGPSSTANNIKVLSTISGQDIEKHYKNDTQYYASFVDGQGDPLDNTMVTFNINGVFYQRKTNENGVAKLNINLNPGEYILTAINPINNEMHSSNVKVLSTISADDLTMEYKDGHRFRANVLDDVGNPLANSNVLFNVNGVFYTRATDNGGNAYLNINLKVGEYVITATNYKGLSVSKKINIEKSNLNIKASDIHIAPGINQNYNVILTGSNNNPIPSVNIKFKYNGATVNAVTNENGEAKILISHPSEGKYSIEYEFEGNMNYYPYKSSRMIIVDNSSSILIGKDLKMSYKDGSKFKVTLTDSNFVPMPNKTVTFNVCGKSYDRSTDENGGAGLNINLIPGTYDISYTYSNIGDADYAKGSNTIVVSKLPAYLATDDLTFVYGESREFTATLTDAGNSPLEGFDVIFNICGKSYVRTTDASGIAKLNINQPVGYYEITTSIDNQFYTASTKSNHVLVDGSILIAYDVSVYPGSYRDYSVKVLDAYENPIVNADIEFIYNGISKHSRTNSEGIATVSVGGLSKGDYPIVYKYADRNNEGQSYLFASEKVLNTKNMISDLSPYLADSQNCQASNAEIVALANRLTGGLTNPLDKARAIFNYVRDTISYGYYYDTHYGAVGTLHSKIGNCVDQSHLSIALYRAAGLPARYVHGKCVFNSGTTYGHVWTQVLVDDTWIAGDTISAANSLGSVVNWNNYNYKLHGYFSYIVF